MGWEVGLDIESLKLEPKHYYKGIEIEILETCGYIPLESILTKQELKIISPYAFDGEFLEEIIVNPETLKSALTKIYNYLEIHALDLPLTHIVKDENNNEVYAFDSGGFKYSLTSYTFFYGEQNRIERRNFIFVEKWKRVDKIR